MIERVLRQPAPARRTPVRIRPAGFTLAELVMVVAVLAGVAGLLVVSVGGVAERAPLDVTRGSLGTVRDAILGRADHPLPSGYRADVGRLPAQLVDLFVRPAGVPPFAPARGLGWRGPYLATSTGAYAPDPLSGFTPHYGDAADPAVLDGWSTPLVLQIPDADANGLPTDEDERHARLLSAGPDGVIQTPRTDAEALPPGTAWYPLQSQCGDDVVLYLGVADLRPQ